MTRLTLEALHQEASRQTGFSEFGDPDYLVGLREVLAAVAELRRYKFAGSIIST